MLTAPGLCWLCRMPLAVAHWGLCSCCTRAVVAPLSVCPACGLPAASRTLPCGRCLQKPPPWQRLVAVSDYALPLEYAGCISSNSCDDPKWQMRWPGCWYWQSSTHAEQHSGRNPICLSAYRFIGIASGAEDITKVICSVVRLPTGYAVAMNRAPLSAFGQRPFSIISAPGYANAT